ncbi:MAG: hypothetical protein P8Y05_01595 [Deinococcales bacterium]
MAVVFTIVVAPSSGPYFGRFYGQTQPLAVMLAAAAGGAAALWVLSRFGFVIIEGRATISGIALSAVFATVLAVAIVMADVLFRYPEDINLALPQALLFYPAIGLTAEVVFHLLPLAFLIPALGVTLRRFGRERVIWFAVALVAVLEPTFQVVVAGGGTGWVDVYTWLHVFAIAASQLYVFRRFDFASMYAFRLIYYLYWHIVWGAIRIPLLF